MQCLAQEMLSICQWPGSGWYYALFCGQYSAVTNNFHVIKNTASHFTDMQCVKLAL